MSRPTRARGFQLDTDNYLLVIIEIKSCLGGCLENQAIITRVSFPWFCLAQKNL